ncbi:pyridoxal-dependent decarboxylase [Mycobacterium kansasii]|uniref:pyridoxal-dependent decarboxylase n=2 Tax=Mycobacterium TaxID=1763 RepID=UPI001604AE85|nr:pyridoxal-dependent decarboxylase [Mycobacterium kansasii]
MAPSQDEVTKTFQTAFRKGQPLWIDDSIMNSWFGSHTDIPSTLDEVGSLHSSWTGSQPGAFWPFSDPLWRETAALLRELGLPVHNNNLNLPEEVDDTWPFNFKSLEREAVISKSARVGDETASGYICNWTEANHYGIRALQQEFRHRIPGKLPLLAYSQIDSTIVESAGEMFGLELLHLTGDTNSVVENNLRSAAKQRPVIFAATLCSSLGRMDDFACIARAQKDFNVLLHVDASRNFDYYTTLSPSRREHLGLSPLRLMHPITQVVEPIGTTINAASIVAAGMNLTWPPLAVVLKPRRLGSLSSRAVEYVRGTDSTLSGSRDGVGPLLLYFQERRFGSHGMREVYERCADNRQLLQDALRQCNIRVHAPPMCLDLIVNLPSSLPFSVQQRWGMVPIGSQSYLISVQPSLTCLDVQGFIRSLANEPLPVVDKQSFRPVDPGLYYVPDTTLADLRRRVSDWRSLAMRSGGYPLNQAPYSALGPVIGHFLGLHIPASWASKQEMVIIEARKRSLGLNGSESKRFAGFFTTGSTMGNRVGVLAALAHCPSGFVYFSSASHYSIKKCVHDNDELTGRRDPDGRPRFGEIPTDDYGRMLSQELVRQVEKDMAFCQARGRPYQIILLANIGTTFTGAVDNLIELRQALQKIKKNPDYIHVDGALDLGFSSDSITLGSSEILTKGDRPVVQGITVSHHKVYGVMVSGEVIFLQPQRPTPGTTRAEVDRRAVLETWLFQKFYTPHNLVQTRDYCQKNTDQLRRLLRGINVVTRFNARSIITLIERLPRWLIHDFHLAPEGDWVHYITMPHISSGAVCDFVQAIVAVEGHFSTMFQHILPALKEQLHCGVKLKRIGSRDKFLLAKLVTLAHDHAQDPRLDSLPSSDRWEYIKQQYVYSAMSFAATDLEHRVLVAFLVKSITNRDFHVETLLLNPELGSHKASLLDIGTQGLALIRHLLDVNVLPSSG